MKWVYLAPKICLLDECLNFNEFIQRNINKCYTIIGIIKKLSSDLPRDALLRIFKSIFRPIMDYGDIIYDKPNNRSFRNKIKGIQYKACIGKSR